MSDNDLIRRGDALAIVEVGPVWVREAIAALPAVTVDKEAFMASVWDALKADANDLRKQQRILKAFLAALEPVAQPAPDRYGKRVSEWQPIETAPRLKAPMIVVMAKLPNGYRSDPYCVWFDAIKDGAPSPWKRWPHPYPPTHWMPLPEPPK